MVSEQGSQLQRILTVKIRNHATEMSTANLAYRTYTYYTNATVIE